MAEGDEELPRDAKIVKSLLKSMGVEDYEPRVIHQFLELWYRYVVDVLTDAQVYSEHAGKTTIDCDDVKLAVQSKVNSSFSQPPAREVLLELAKNRNKIPLPKSIAGSGIPLPPQQDTLISPNYQLSIVKKQSAQAAEEEMEEDEQSTEPNATEEQRTDMPQQTTPQKITEQLESQATGMLEGKEEVCHCCKKAQMKKLIEPSSSIQDMLKVAKSRHFVRVLILKPGYTTVSNGQESKSLK